MLQGMFGRRRHRRTDRQHGQIRKVLEYELLWGHEKRAYPIGHALFLINICRTNNIVLIASRTVAFPSSCTRTLSIELDREYNLDEIYSNVSHSRDHDYGKPGTIMTLNF